MAQILEHPGGDVQEQLRVMAGEIIHQLSSLDAAMGKEQLLGGLVSELFLAVAKETQQQERRQKQAAGIAAAKARGVRFGRPPKPLPESYHSAYQRWMAGAITGSAAARECGMPLSTFRYRSKLYRKV